jgi:hypothetical protein
MVGFCRFVYFFPQNCSFDLSSSWASENLMIVVGFFFFFDKIFFDGWFFHVNVIFFFFFPFVISRRGGLASTFFFLLFNVIFFKNICKKIISQPFRGGGRPCPPPFVSATGRMAKFTRWPICMGLLLYYWKWEGSQLWAVQRMAVRCRQTVLWSETPSTHSVSN